MPKNSRENRDQRALNSPGKRREPRNKKAHPPPWASLPSGGNIFVSTPTDVRRLDLSILSPLRYIFLLRSSAFPHSLHSHSLKRPFPFPSIRFSVRHLLHNYLFLSYDVDRPSLKMRVSSIIPLVAAVLPAAVSARGTLGFSLGNKNPDGTCKSTSDYKKDFEALKPVSNLVRTYSASDCHTAENIIPAAKDTGFKVVLGVWYVLHNCVYAGGSGY